VVDLGARLTIPLTGAIVAGGRATRMGGVAKGLLDVGGTRMIDRVARALADVSDDVVVVANAEDAGTWIPQARVIRDRIADRGSAGGIHAALVELERPVLAVAWDMPFVSSGVLRVLVDAATAGEFDAVVPQGQAADLEPLCAWYAPAFAVRIEAAPASALQDLLRDARTHVVPRETIATIGNPERLFFNVNTTHDLQRAQEMAAQ
jgi:molybdopterin-guanine dinucleotide biosynthesis protein A